MWIKLKENYPKFFYSKSKGNGCFGYEIEANALKMGHFSEKIVW